MNNIYVLSVMNEECGDDYYFTTLEKAQLFIKDNYSCDNVKQQRNTYFEGKKNTYNIQVWAVNQDRL